MRVIFMAKNFLSRIYLRGTQSDLNWVTVMCATGWTMKTERRKVPLSSKNSSVRLQSNRSLSEDSDERELREKEREDWGLKLVRDVCVWERVEDAASGASSQSPVTKWRKEDLEPLDGNKNCSLVQNVWDLSTDPWGSTSNLFFPKQEVEIKKWETRENEWREGFLFFPQVLMAFIHRPRPFRSLTLLLWSFYWYE